MAAHSLTFQGTQFDVVDRQGQTWLKAVDIARALGYSREDSVSRIYERNTDEFTQEMSQTVNLTVSQNNGLLTREVRIFSLRGAHLIAMFARTPTAKAFRRWVLDILDSMTSPAFTNPDTRTSLREAVRLLVHRKHLGYGDAYGVVHQRFAVQHIDQLTADQIPQAVEYLHHLALEGEWQPAPRPLASPSQGYWLSEPEARWLKTMFLLQDKAINTLVQLRQTRFLQNHPLNGAAYDSSAHLRLYQDEWQNLRQYCMRLEG